MAAHHRITRAKPISRELVAAFADEMFADLPRADQRRWARVYLEGLLTVQGRKSIRQVASVGSDSPTASQSLQQFINASPWDWGPVRQALARRVCSPDTAQAWTIRTAIQPKRGDHSCGVHRRFVPSAGRTLNCQVGVGVFLSTRESDIPLEWRLLLPEVWGEDTRLRQRARIPAGARHQPLWAQVLDLADHAACRIAATPLPVVADMSDACDAAPLVDGLTRRGHGFLVAVPPSLALMPVDPRGAGPGSGRDAMPARHLLRRSAPHLVTADPEAGAGSHSRVLSYPVRLPGSSTSYRLLSRQEPGAARPPVWLTNLSGRIDHLLSLTQLHARTTAAMVDLERNYGMLDFEGRSFPGWHHHMTLISAAYAYRQLVEPLAPTGSALPQLRQVV